MPAVVRMAIRGEPMPRAIVAEAYVDAPRSIVTGNEPPDVRIEVPTRLYENVVHALDDTMAVDPDVVAIAIRPITIDPDRARTLYLGLHDHHRLRSRRRLLGRCHRIGLLNDDHGFALDLLGRPIFCFDDYVRRCVVGCGGLTFTLIAVMRHVQFVAGRAAVAVCALVVGGHRYGDCHQGTEGEQGSKSNEEIHGSSYMCMAVWTRRHPPSPEQARPARQSA